MRSNDKVPPKNDNARSKNAHAKKDSGPLGPDKASARKVVLIVEDEPLLLMLAISMVEDAGFEALSAFDADQAIAILLTRLDICVVFTDIDMPGSMDGLKLAAAVRDRWPPIEIIVTSGQVTPVDADLPARSCFFAKPYNPDRVVEAMHRLAA